MPCFVRTRVQEEICGKRAEPFVCFLTPRRGGTTTGLCMACSDILAESPKTQKCQILFLCNSRRACLVTETRFRSLHPEREPGPGIKFDRATAHFHGSSPSSVCIDGLEHVQFVECWRNVALPLHVGGGLKCIFSICPQFPAKLAARLPEWIGELENYITFDVDFLSARPPSFVASLDLVRRLNSVEQCRVQNPQTGNRLLFKRMQIGQRAGSELIHTSIRFVVIRAVTAGDGAIETLPDVKAELGLTDAELGTITKLDSENFCFFQRPEIMFISRHQFDEDLFPVLNAYAAEF